MTVGLYGAASTYLQQAQAFRRNVRLYLWVSVIDGAARGIFSVVFNLYILSLGIEADVLGLIAAAAPLATALGSIPAGFVTEVLGHKRALALIYATLGLSIALQVSVLTVPWIVAAAFLGGLASAGSFVVRLPFLAANSDRSQLTYAISASLLLFNLANAAGALLGGYLPSWARWVSPRLSVAYRLTMYVAAAVAVLAVVPVWRMSAAGTGVKKRISPSLYLWRLDGTTVKVGAIAICRGLSLGVTIPFLNVFFVYHLGASREFFGTVRALEIVPRSLATALGPAVASSIGLVRSVALMRSLAAIPILAMTAAALPILAALAVWVYRVTAGMAQPLTFTLAMQAANEATRGVTAAWLNVAFWLGNTLAAPVTGWFIAQSNYLAPFYLSALATVVAGLLNYLFFGSLGAQRGADRDKS